MSRKNKNRIEFFFIGIGSIFLGKLLGRFFSEFMSTLGIVPYIIYVVIVITIMIVVRIIDKKKPNNEDKEGTIKEAQVLESFGSEEIVSVEDERINKKKENKFVAIASIVSLLVIAAIAADLIYMAVLKSDVEKANEKIDFQKSVIDDLHDDLDKASEKLEFYDYAVVFCDDNSKYYHRYDCDKWNRDSFYAFNSENAKSQGYKPCPDCCIDKILENY